MRRFGIEAHVYDGVHVEPTDASLQQAIDHATEHGPWDAYVAVGGGSSIDTAKAVNLLTTNLNHVWQSPQGTEGPWLSAWASATPEPSEKLTTPIARRSPRIAHYGRSHPLVERVSR
jgi:alcohol dehydrogenase class IV